MSTNISSLVSAIVCLLETNSQAASPPKAEYWSKTCVNGNVFVQQAQTLVSEHGSNIRLLVLI